MSRKKHAYNGPSTLCGKDVFEVSVAIDDCNATCKHCLKKLFDEQIAAINRYEKRIIKAREKRHFYFEKLRTEQ